MYLSNGTRVVSFLQLQATTATIILLLFFGDAQGKPSLLRMPAYFGKRSAESITSRDSTNFGLGNKLESFLSSSSSKDRSAKSHFLDLPRKRSLVNLVSNNDLFSLPDEDLALLKDYFMQKSGHDLKEKRELETTEADEEEMILNSVRKISEYNAILEKIIDNNRRLQNDLVQIYKEEAEVSPERSRVEDMASGFRHAQSLKRGTLSRLPQFYGKKK